MKGATLGLPALLLVICSGCGKPMEEPLLPQNVTDFNLLFAQNCAGCHGADGKNGAAQSLHDSTYLAFVPKETLRSVIENGRQGTLMPAFARAQGGSLYPKQVDVLVNGIEQRWAGNADLNGANAPAYQAASDGDAARGQQLFLTACAKCHGENGSAGSVTNASYLKLASDQSLRTAVVAGRLDFGMPDWRGDLQGHALSDQEITDIVAYMTSLRQPSTRVSQAGAGEAGPETRGNEGSGYGPGSKRKEDNEGTSTGASSQGGGAGSKRKTNAPKHQ